MKKFLLLAAILTVVFTACEQPTNENDPGSTLPNLTIRNESSYILTDVKFSGISFAASGSNDLPTSSQSVKRLTANDLNKTGYITFIRKDIGIACRTEAISIGEENYTFTFLDTSVVEESANTSNRKSLSQITFISKVTIELGGLAVPRNDIIDIEEFVNFTKQTEFTLKNTGVGKLLLTGTQPVKLTGTGAEAFSVVQPTSSEIAPDNSLTFKLTFSPGAIQDYNATVTLNSNDQDGDFTFTIKGRGIPPKPIATMLYEDSEIAQNGTIDADEVFITLSKNITVTIKNTGVEVLTLDTADITITGADAGAFTKTTNPGDSISVGGQTSFVIECSPTKQGENNAILSIPTNDNSRNPVTIYLKVTGVKGSAILELTQGNTIITNNSLTPFDFGRVEINSNKSLSFMIKNTGNIALNLSETSLITSTNTAFEILSQPVTKTLIPGASVNFTIRFTPTAERNEAASIDIPNDSDEGVFTLAITGTGYVKRPQITIAYGNTAIAQNGTIDAGQVLLTLSKNITVTIKNTGEEVLTVDTANITITGANPVAFTKITNPGGSISVGGQSSFDIKCEPVAQGENTATLTIPSNDINRSPAIVYLKFTGVKGSGILSLKQNNTIIGNNSITPFNFGRTALGSSTSLVFTITNNGNIPLILTGTPAVVSSNAVFTVSTQPANTTISPAATTQFIIQYTPTLEQDDTGTITIANDSNDTLFVLNVKGTGYVKRPQISVFYGNTEIPPYGTLNAGNAVITQSKDITVIIKNTGEELLTVDTANVTITGASVFTKTTNPAANVSVGGQTQFVISCTPDTEGEYQATLTIPTNDSFRTPYIVYVQATAVPVTYQIGDTGPAGGIIFYDNGSVINGWRYLEASLNDFTAQWGASNLGVTGPSLNNTTGLSIGNGKQNTQIIVAALNQRGETGRAAQVCVNLDINGFTDWFLPSRDELNLMYQNLHSNGLGNFSAADYWSSTENSALNGVAYAWNQSFSYGSQRSTVRRDTVCSVRAIRSF
jgi:hypothetical protein